MGTRSLKCMISSSASTQCQTNNDVTMGINACIEIVLVGKECLGKDAKAPVYILPHKNLINVNNILFLLLLLDKPQAREDSLPPERHARVCPGEQVPGDLGRGQTVRQPQDQFHGLKGSQLYGKSATPALRLKKNDNKNWTRIILIIEGAQDSSVHTVEWYSEGLMIEYWC